MEPKELIRRGMARSADAGRQELQDLLELAKRDIEVAQSTLAQSIDWAEAIAYNSMLQSGRALMLFRGLRPSGQSHHLAVLWFLEGELGSDDHDLVLSMSSIRKRRNSVLYVRRNGTSRARAEESIASAKALFRLVIHVTGL